MESELTRKIKRGLSHFRLAMPTVLRTPRYAEEVWTPTGIVDFIRFEDCKVNIRSKCKLVHHTEFPPEVIAAVSPKFTPGECKLTGHTFPNEHCKQCIFRYDTYDVGRRITCFEIKISKDDFRSAHGHNFHGHCNYYVMPNELAEELKYEIPAHIGLIAYYPNSNYYRVVKECIPQDVTPELEATLLYNAFKKWVDRCQNEYWTNANKIEFTSHTLGDPTKGEILW